MVAERPSGDCRHEDGPRRRGVDRHRAGYNSVTTRLRREPDPNSTGRSITVLETVMMDDGHHGQSPEFPGQQQRQDAIEGFPSNMGDAMTGRRGRARSKSPAMARGRAARRGRAKSPAMASMAQPESSMCCNCSMPRKTTRRYTRRGRGRRGGRATRSASRSRSRRKSPAKRAASAMICVPMPSSRSATPRRRAASARRRTSTSRRRGARMRSRTPARRAASAPRRGRGRGRGRGRSRGRGGRTGMRRARIASPETAEPATTTMTNSAPCPAPAADDMGLEKE